MASRPATASACLSVSSSITGLQEGSGTPPSRARSRSRKHWGYAKVAAGPCSIPARRRSPAGRIDAVERGAAHQPDGDPAALRLRLLFSTPLLAQATLSNFRACVNYAAAFLAHGRPQMISPRSDSCAPSSSAASAPVHRPRGAGRAGGRAGRHRLYRLRLHGADSLHVGSLVQIMMLRLLQRHGHRPLVLMGGGTTRIGDPSGSDEARQLLTDEQIAANMAGIRRCSRDSSTSATGRPTRDGRTTPTGWTSSPTSRSCATSARTSPSTAC